MTQILTEQSLDITMGHPIKITQDMSFENFDGQFQEVCPKLLCVINGTTLHFHDNMRTIPTKIRFDHKQQRGGIVEYYFRNIEDNTLYCVFGREAATLFFPDINNIDKIADKPPEIKLPISRNPIIQRLNVDNSNLKNVITVIDNSVVLTFPNPNYPVELLTYYPS